MSTLTRLLLLLILVAFCGCAPDLRPNAKSQVNVIADKWDGSDEFKVEENDPWGNPVTAKVTKGDVYSTLMVRSAGPDGLPYTKDDLTASREKKHTAVSKIVGVISKRSRKEKRRGLSKASKRG